MKDGVFKDVQSYFDTYLFKFGGVPCVTLDMPGGWDQCRVLATCRGLQALHTGTDGEEAGGGT